MNGPEALNAANRRDTFGTDHNFSRVFESKDPSPVLQQTPFPIMQSAVFVQQPDIDQRHTPTEMSPSRKES